MLALVRLQVFGQWRSASDFSNFDLGIAAESGY